MQFPALRLTSNFSKLCKRNLGVFAPSLQKVNDSIQQLFIDKIREYKSKSVGGKLVDPSPELEKELKNDKERVRRQFGLGTNEDLTKFPSFSFKETQYEHPGLKKP